MSLGKPGAVDLLVNGRDFPRLTLHSRRRGYVIDPRYQQIFRDATGRTCGSRGLCLSFQEAEILTPSTGRGVLFPAISKARFRWNGPSVGA
jgi:hypothetical protein